MTAWEEALQVTGGSLAPQKSYWTPICYSDKGNKGNPSQPAAAGLRLWMRDKTGQRQEVEKLDMDEARTMLGVNLAADGNNRSQVERMMKAATVWQEAIRTGKLHRSDAWTGLRTTIMKTLEYPLAATTLSQQECNKIMAKVLSASLPAGGVWRHMPRSVVHGPVNMTGLGIPDLYVLQGAQHVRNWVSHCTTNSTTGKLLRHSLEALTIEVGAGRDVWKQDYTKFGALASDSLAKTTWKFLQEGNIEIAHPVQVPPLRDKDTFIMATAARLGWKGKRLQHINEVRKWMSVMTWSEIMNLEGTKIVPSAWKAQRQPALRDYGWPQTTEPTGTQLREWRKFLTETQRQRDVTGTSLGEWKIDLMATEWPTFGDATGSVIYVKNEGKLHDVYRTDGRKIRAPIGRLYHRTGRRVAIPKTATAAEGIPEGPSAIRCTGWTTTKTKITNREKGDTQQQDYNPTTWYAMTDGSYKDGHATAAWGVKAHLHHNDYILTGENISPGRPIDQSAYRAELSGLLGLVRHADEKWGRHRKHLTIEVGCDCLSAINILTNSWEPETAQTPHGDLIHATRTAIRQSPINWQFRHIRGHQDAKKGKNQLTDWERMNVDMDDSAKRHWERTKGLTTQQGIGEDLLPWQVRIQGQSVPHRIQQEIIHHWNGSRLRRYWKEKGQITDTDMELWDWDALRRAMASLPVYRQVWVAKWSTGHYGHGKAMLRWGLRTSDKCPRCGKPENSRHLLVCKGPTADSTWKERIADLHEWLSKQDTAPAIRKSIIEGLEHCRSGMWATPPSVAPQNPTSQAVIQQNRIGWQGLFVGRLAIGWERFQSMYWKRRKKRKSSKLWAASLLRRLWEIAWALWEDRNKVLHNREQGQRHALLSEVVDKYIREAFAKGYDDLPETEQAMFRKGMQAVLRQPLDTKEAWMRSIQAATGR